MHNVRDVVSGMMSRWYLVAQNGYIAPVVGAPFSLEVMTMDWIMMGSYRLYCERAIPCRISLSKNTKLQYHRVAGSKLWMNTVTIWLCAGACLQQSITIRRWTAGCVSLQTESLSQNTRNYKYGFSTNCKWICQYRK